MSTKLYDREVLISNTLNNLQIFIKLHES